MASNNTYQPRLGHQGLEIIMIIDGRSRIIVETIVIFIVICTLFGFQFSRTYAISHMNAAQFETLISASPDYAFKQSSLLDGMSAVQFETLISTHPEIALNNALAIDRMSDEQFDQLITAHPIVALKSAPAIEHMSAAQFEAAKAACIHSQP
jgi:hypothetical protein